MLANPAVLSAALQSLLPQSAVVAELRGAGEVALLLPAEAAHLGRSVPKRAQEFAAGRLCARRALAEFGLADFPIEMAADRRPVWPPAMVGSITHTEGFCAAVAAERRALQGVGLDSEGADRVTPKLWKSTCVAAEIEWLESLDQAERSAGASLIFSAKEAFYKCQYPLTGEFLGFHDVRLRMESWNAARGQISIEATRAIAFNATSRMPIVGEYLFHDRFVTTAFWLAAGENQ